MYLKIAEKYIAESRMADARLIVIDAETGFPILWSDAEYVQTSHLIAYCGSLSFVHKFSRLGPKRSRTRSSGSDFSDSLSVKCGGPGGI